MMIWLALPQFAVAVLAVVCSKTIREDRTYHPMLKVVFAALAFVTAGAGVNSLGQWAVHPAIRTLSALVFLAAVGHAAWFIRKRNVTPRFIRLLLNGEFVIMTTEELDHASNLAESWANHGTMPPARMASLRAALDEGERKRRWADEGLPQQLAERRARRRGTPDDAGGGE